MTSTEESTKKAEGAGDGDSLPVEEKGPQKQSNAFAVACWAICNVALSVGLVTVNKIIMQKYEFTFVFTLTFCHFVATSICLELITRMGWFGASVKYLPSDTNFLTAAAGVASIAFMNFSLRANSVGFYQITKLCVIPVVLVIDYFSAGKTVSSRVLLSLLLLLAGVGIATVTDVELKTVGLVFAVLAVGSTAQFQIWQGSMQKQYALSPLQMTHSVAVPQALITLVGVITFERHVASHTFSPDLAECWLILVTCFMAIGVNVTSMGLIGKTSAVTFQVVGHAKTCLIITSGFLFFTSEINVQTAKNLAGVCIAVVAMIWYGQLKSQEAAKASLSKEDDLKAREPGRPLETVSVNEPGKN